MYLLIVLTLCVTCSSFELDENSVTFHEDFENDAEYDTKWTKNSDMTIVDGIGVGGGAALRCTYRPSDKGSDRLSTRFSLSPAMEYTLVYDVLFEVS